MLLTTSPVAFAGKTKLNTRTLLSACLEDQDEVRLGACDGDEDLECDQEDERLDEKRITTLIEEDADAAEFAEAVAQQSCVVGGSPISTVARASRPNTPGGAELRLHILANPEAAERVLSPKPGMTSPTLPHASRERSASLQSPKNLYATNRRVTFDE